MRPPRGTRTAKVDAGGPPFWQAATIRQAIPPLGDDFPPRPAVKNPKKRSISRHRWQRTTYLAIGSVLMHHSVLV